MPSPSLLLRLHLQTPLSAMDEGQWRRAEDLEDEEDAGGGLVRSRRSVKGETFRAEDGNEGEGAAEEESQDDGHRRSVFFDEAQGGLPTSEITADKKSANGAYETNRMPSSLAPQSDIEILTSLVSNSETSYPIDNTVEKPGLEEFHQDEPMQKNRWSWTETDVERVLEEQETHDLYCPNCNSCITKRVILRKRKRRVREIHFDVKREKIEPVQANILPNLDVDGAPAEHPAREPYLFRCLSCFSFFVPIAEGGFRLFKGFWGKDSADENLRSSQPVPAKSQSESASFSKVTNEGENQGKGTLASAGIKAEPQTPKLKKYDLIKDSEVIFPISGSQQAKIHDILGEPHDRIEGKLESRVPQVLEKSEIVTEEYGEFKSENTTPEQRGHVGEVAFASATIKAETRTSTTEKDDSMKEREVFSPILEPQRAKIPDILEEQGKADMEIPKITKNYDDRIDEISEITTEDYGDALAGKITPEKMGRAGERFISEVMPLIKPQPGMQDYVHVVIIPEKNVDEGSGAREWDVLKAIVYGGLVESITSLGVVSAASGADTHTLNVTALGLANFIGGLILIFHNLMELRKEAYEVIDPQYEYATCYWKSLGKRGHFRLHAIVALISYIIFGLLPVVIYGFSFRKSDNKEYKLIVVAVGSLICIALLSLAKARVQRGPKPYLKYLFSYIVLGFSVSGLAYVAGIFIEKFFESVGTFGTDNSINSTIPSMELAELNSKNTGWSLY